MKTLEKKLNILTFTSLILGGVLAFFKLKLLAGTVIFFSLSTSFFLRILSGHKSSFPTETTEKNSFILPEGEEKKNEILESFEGNKFFRRIIILSLVSAVMLSLIGFTDYFSSLAEYFILFLYGVACFWEANSLSNALTDEKERICAVKKDTQIPIKKKEKTWIFFVLFIGTFFALGCKDLWSALPFKFMVLIILLAAITFFFSLTDFFAERRQVHLKKGSTEDIILPEWMWIFAAIPGAFVLLLIALLMLDFLRESFK